LNFIALVAEITKPVKALKPSIGGAWSCHRGCVAEITKPVKALKRGN